jgi:protein-L-isoaspartate(D-aspartate) O-methyltransferase
MDLAEYWTTDDDYPSQVYHDVLIALDESRGINNGQPSLWAYLFDRLELVPGELVLHLGCGTGYYSAIIAELVGSAGRVTAVEIDPTLAQRAQAALADWRQVTMIHADGAGTSFEPVDAIVASAGATHPLSSWLDALRPGGRVLFPMTTSRDGPGAMLLVKRRTDDRFAARFVCRVGFIDFQGARDPAISRRLAAALRRDLGAAVKSLRRDIHGKDETCWLHGDGWCLSRRDVGGQD